jgi:hypothetical protein
MADIKVRVGQQNSIKVVSAFSGGASFAENSNNSVNVIGGIASVTQLNVSGITTLNQLNVLGITTFLGDVNFNGNLIGIIDGGDY